MGLAPSLPLPPTAHAALPPVAPAPAQTPASFLYPPLDPPPQALLPPAPATRESFLGQVYDMLTPPGTHTHTPGSFSWRNDGVSIVVKNPTLFETTLLPSVFPGQTQTKTLLRALQNYDFKHKTQKGGHIIIKHSTLTIRSTRADWVALPRKEPQRRLTHVNFLGLVYDMLASQTELTKAVIGWSDDGKAIMIWDPIALEKKVLPVCIPTQHQVHTFTRALHFYGFARRTEYGSGHISLAHPDLTKSSTRKDFLSVPHSLYKIMDDNGVAVESPFALRSAQSSANTDPDKQAPSKVFIGRVHDMLSADDDDRRLTINWSADGQHIVISDTQKFLNDVLPVFFPRQTQIKSFVRNLKLYGFDRVNDNVEDQMAFRHPKLNSHSTRADFHTIPRHLGPAEQKRKAARLGKRKRRAGAGGEEEEHDDDSEQEEDELESDSEKQPEKPKRKRARLATANGITASPSASGSATPTPTPLVAALPAVGTGPETARIEPLPVSTPKTATTSPGSALSSIPGAQSSPVARPHLPTAAQPQEFSQSRPYPQSHIQPHHLQYLRPRYYFPVQRGPPYSYLFDPTAVYADGNVQAWVQYYAAGGKELAGTAYFISVPGVTDTPLYAQMRERERQKFQMERDRAQLQQQFAQARADSESDDEEGGESGDEDDAADPAGMRVPSLLPAVFAITENTAEVASDSDGEDDEVDEDQIRMPPPPSPARKRFECESCGVSFKLVEALESHQERTGHS
uniref:C2H2-type domain-containing protein n=1 Tax=Mycena chlorophos TaxID=658473 RepID=A0ABQ0M1A2_MYCCL|nr:predicted protein [Mycena chlorophos]